MPLNIRQHMDGLTEITDTNNTTAPTGGNGETNEDLAGVLFTLCFVLFWNSMLSVPTIKAISGVVRGECNEEVFNLLCCNWIFAFVVPFAGFKGLLRALPIEVAIIFFLIAYVAPYSIAILLELKKISRGEQPCCPHSSLLKELFGFGSRETLWDDADLDLSTRDTRNIQLTLISAPNKTVDASAIGTLDVSNGSIRNLHAEI